MEKVYENMNKYGEEMKGKFSHNPHGNGIVISVTSPFVEEIHIESDDNIHKAYSETYWLLPPQAEHPKGEYRSIYYNTEEQRYYRSEWRERNPGQQEAEWGYIWVITDKEYITKHAKECEKLQAHYHSYHDIHKGQLCVFRGYAVDPNGDFKKPSTVESMFDRHKWFFNPWSFKVSLLDENTVDDFVEETPISKEMTNQMVRYHDLEDKARRQAERKEFCRNLLDKISKFAQFVEKYPTWFRTIIAVIVGGLLTFLLSNIGTILKWFFK